MRENPWFGRLLACLALGIALAISVGNVEGTFDDIGLAFREQVLSPRVFVFLAIGLLVFGAISAREVLRPYVTRPGIWPLVAGTLTVVAGRFLLNWFDQIGKFNLVAPAVAQAKAVNSLTKSYFAWTWWVLLVVTPVLLLVAIIFQFRPLAWLSALVAVVGIWWTIEAHSEVVDVGKAIDHSLGSQVVVIGYLVLLLTAVTVALSKAQVANGKLVLARVFGFRPGLALIVGGLIVGVVGFGSATWFSPSAKNSTLVDTSHQLSGKGLAPIAAAYISWLGWVLFAVLVVGGAVAAWLRAHTAGWVLAVIGLVAVVLTLVSLYKVSSLGAALKLDGATGPWQNLGAGGWMAGAAFLLLAGGGYVVATTKETPAVEGPVVATKPGAAVSADTVKASKFSTSAMTLRWNQLPGAQQTLFFVAVAAAIFYPPTASQQWQNVLVTQVGVYVLLAIGLNVVVGWAGLLDLGYIGFYALGSYTTAYLVGSLPVKPPSWLHFSPLVAIPFAILVCVLAGVILGAPTLRLRGDYLAIVTLGFGEIIRITAVNLDNVTGSTRGVSPPVPHPVIDLGFVRISWGGNNLQYWYLLLVIIVLLVVLFRRLEGSRIGRAWAAIREDEIAASATGINTTKVKLTAFAIGASTSGLAGVFFASQVGYFNPTNFVLNNSFLVLAYVVFGGMGSLPGAIAGAAVLTWLPQFLKDQVPGADLQLWIGIIMILMMIFRPGGLIPARRRATELRGLSGESSAEERAVPESEGLGAAEGAKT